MVHPLLTRALVTAAASIVSTTVWVKTAESPKKCHLSQRDDDEKPEDGLRHTLRRAQIDVEPASAALRTEVFFENILHAPQNMMARLKGQKSEVDEEQAAEEATRSPVREKKRGREPNSLRRKRRVDKRKKSDRDKVEQGVGRKRRRKKSDGKSKKRKGEDQDWGIGASIRAEVKKQVKEVAVESIKETLETAGDKLADTKDALLEKGQDLSASLKSSMPDDVTGTLSSAAESIKEGAGRFSEKVSNQVKEAMPESAGDLSKDVSSGLRGIGRFLQGPGSQNYDETSLRNADSDATFVSAQIEGEGKKDSPLLSAASRAVDGEDEKKPLDEVVKFEDAPLASLGNPAGRSVLSRRLEAMRGNEVDEDARS